MKNEIINFCKYLYKEINPSYGSRPMIQYIRNNGKKRLVGVEIGVYEGANAYNILRMLDIEHLYLIDPFIYDAGGYKRVVQHGYNATLIKAKHRLKPYRTKIILIKKLSDDAVKDVPDNLDFVYIDGGHNYNHVLNDIKNYYPKVRIGGIIGGHDFTADKDMFKAPAKFAHDMKLKLTGRDNDWWVIKR